MERRKRYINCSVPVREIRAIFGGRGMKSIRILFFCGLTGICVQGWAHEPHVCATGVDDVPAMKALHTEQADLVAGVYDTETIFTKGGALAESRFNECDGQGRPATTGGGAKREPGQPNMIRTSGPEGSSCQGCHAQPRSGGSGDFVANTFNGTENLDPVTESIDPSLSNERNTTGMFGAGYLELVGREMTADLKAQAKTLKTAAATGWYTLTTKGVSFDVQFKAGSIKATRGIDKDLIVKPFGAGGTVASIRQFTVQAFNRHHGMQAEESYDIYLGDPDYDEDGVTRELTIGDLTVTALWQAMLQRPVEEKPEAEDQAAVDQGRALFTTVGCASCHLTQITLNNRNFCEPYKYNPPQIFHDTSQKVCILLNYADDDADKTDTGDDDVPPANQALVLAPYTDLKRHRMCDDAALTGAIRTLCNEQLTEGRQTQDGIPGTEFFLTAELWGLRESAPYGHSGHFTSISSIVLAHAGDARAARDAYTALMPEDRIAIIKFLQTLEVPDQTVRVVDG